MNVPEAEAHDQVMVACRRFLKYLEKTQFPHRRVYNVARFRCTHKAKKHIEFKADMIQQRFNKALILLLIPLFWCSVGRRCMRI